MDSSITDRFLFLFSISKASSSFDHRLVGLHDGFIEWPENEPRLDLCKVDDDDTDEECGRSIKI